MGEIKLQECYRIVCFSFLSLCALVVFSSCGNNRQSTEIPASPQKISSDCRMIKHTLGETCVPINPSRVIALDDCTLEPMLALNLQPIGAPVSNVNIPNQGDLSSIQDTGSPPNLETIFSLKPDLILGCAYLQDVYKQVTKMAPTVIVPTESSADWKSVLFLVADAVVKTSEAEQVMSAYTKRIEALQSELGEQINATEVSVIRIHPGHISLYAKDVFIGTLLADVGLSRPKSQVRDVPAIDISKENIHDADGDVIFVWVYGSNRQLSESAETALKKLQSDPLWQELEAVKSGKVYVVPEYWIGAGPLSANAVIDDLFKHLVN
ncbi:MAG: iron-siderophore ABC transporter substrate-binding protein [Nodosilinea sp.]